MRVEIHHYHHYDEAELHSINRKLEAIMATLDQVLSDVTDESTQIDGLATLISGLRQQVADAVKNAGIPPDVQAKIDQVFAQAEANKAKIANALAANNAPDPQPTQPA